jgi:hypothetical protein
MSESKQVVGFYWHKTVAGCRVEWTYAESITGHIVGMVSGCMYESRGGWSAWLGGAKSRPFGACTSEYLAKKAVEGVATHEITEEPSAHEALVSEYEPELSNA